MKDLANWQGLHKMQAIVTWKAQQCTRDFLSESSGGRGGKKERIFLLNLQNDQ